MNNNLVGLTRNHNQSQDNHSLVLNQYYFGLCMVDTNIEHEAQAFVYNHQIKFYYLLKPFVNLLLIVAIHDLLIFVRLLLQKMNLFSGYNGSRKV